MQANEKVIAARQVVKHTPPTQHEEETVASMTVDVPDILEEPSPNLVIEGFLGELELEGLDTTVVHLDEKEI